LKRAAHPWWVPPAAWLGAALLRVIGATWRIEWHDAARADGGVERGGKRIYAFWHARLLPLIFTHRGVGAAVLISRHRDGELVARVIRHMGFVTARGSSTRGGGQGFVEMLRFAGEGRALGITPDGPRGPAERVKAGTIELASRTEWPIICVGVAVRDAWTLRSWDRFKIPKPFTRLALVYGPALTVPRDLDHDAVDAWCDRVGDTIRASTERAQRALGGAAS